MHPLRNGMKNDYDAEEDIPLGDMEDSGLRWMSVAVVLLVVAGFFALAWYAYRSSDQAGESDDIVRAEAGPIKERPADPGGMETPYQDMSVYNVLNDEPSAEEDKVERLLPEPEEPMAARDAEPAPESMRRQPEDMQVWIKEKTAVDEEISEPSTEVKPDASAQTTVPPAEPRTPDTAEGATPAAAEVTEGEKAEPHRFMEDKPSEAAPTPPVETVEVEEVPVAVPATPVTPKVEPVTTPAAKPAPVKPAAASAPSTSEKGNLQAQLGALKTPSEANTLWSQLKRKHADLLGGKQYLIVKAELPQGTFYRLRVSGLSATSAKNLCAALSARKQGCMVVR